MRFELILLLAAFATYRLALLFTKERGPFKIFERLRKLSKREAKEWLSCIFCFSMTTSAFVCGLLYLDSLHLTIVQWFFLWLSLSAISVALNQAFTKS